MAERHLPGEPKQDVEPDPDDRRQGDEREHERRVAVGLRRRQQPANGQREDSERHREASGGAPHGQTLFTAARPNSPLGMKARPRITTLKTTIWV